MIIIYSKYPYNKSMIELKVLSFNILADVLANGGNFTKLYPHKGHLLKWSNRYPMIIDIITSYDPDIFCLAECNHYYQFKAEFSERGYDSIYAQKASNNPWRVFQDFKRVINQNTELSKIVNDNFFDKEWYNLDQTQLGDGVAIFYKINRFELLSKSCYESNPVSVHTLLKDKITKDNIIVTMTHLKSKRANHHIRLEQIHTIFNRINAIDSSNDVKSIICADLNADDTERTPFEVLNRCYKSAYGQTEGSNTILLPLWTTYKWRGPIEVSPPKADLIPTDVALQYPPNICGKQQNEVTGLDCHTIDYIFVRGMKIVETLTTDTDIVMVDDQDVGIPNEKYPSDHIAIGVRLE